MIPHFLQDLPLNQQTLVIGLLRSAIRQPKIRTTEQAFAFLIRELSVRCRRSYNELEADSYVTSIASLQTHKHDVQQYVARMLQPKTEVRP